MAIYKIILVTILCLFVTFGFSQQYTPMTASGYQMKRLKADSTLHIPSFCGIPTLRNSIAKEGAIAIDTCNNKLYKWTNANGWREVTGGGTLQDLASVLNVGNKGYKNAELYATDGSDNSVIISPNDNDGMPELSLNDSLNQSIKLQTQTKFELPAISFNKNSDYQLLLFNNGSLGTVYMPDQRYDLPNSVEDTLATLRNIRNVSFDSTSLSNRINLKLNISDTNQMLNHYLHSVDTVYLSNRIDTKLNISDTATMLSPYLRNNIASATYQPIGSYATTAQLATKLNITDTSAMLTPYLRSNIASATYQLIGNYATTSQLATKLNISDTANKWVYNITRESGKDSIIYYIGSNRYAIKDSVGSFTQTGRFGNDTATIVMAKVHNDAGVTLTNGKVVFLGTSGTSADVPSVRLANNKADSTSANTFGFVSGTINVNDTGWIILSGKIEKLNTSAFANGDIIYLDSISGNWTKSKPVAPYHMVYLGVVVKANAGNGSIFVKCQNGYELDEIHDVLISGKVNNNIIVYSDTQKVWKNRSIYSVIDTVNIIASKTDISKKVNISDTSSMLSPYLRSNIASATYQPIGNYATTTQLATKVNISDTSTMLQNYAKTSIVNTKANSSTSISTSSPLSGGGDLSANRTLSISQATTSTNGYLSSTDWNTFNGKQNALTNPVTGTGTSGTVTKFTGTSTIGDATVDVDYLQQDISLVAMQAMGSSVKGYTLISPIPTAFQINSNLGTQIMNIIAIYVPKSVTVTGVRWYQVTNGNYTASNYNGVGLYQNSGGTLNLIISSTNDGNIWQQGTGWQSKAFSSTQTISRGIYYIAHYASWSAVTTVPTLLSCATSASAYANTNLFDFTNGNRLFGGTGTLGALSAMPATMTTSIFSGNANRFLFYIY